MMGTMIDAALRMLLVLALAACGGAQKAPPPPPPDDPALAEPPSDDAGLDALIDKMLARVDQVAQCATSGRVWCIAARGWASGDAGPLPKERFLAAGVSVALIEEYTDDDLLSGVVTFSALGARGEGKQALALSGDVNPQTASEQRLVAQAIDATVAVFKNKAEDAAIPAALHGYIEKLIPAAKYPLTRAGKEWRYTGAARARVRKVGPHWVVIEVPPKGPRGILLSIYTDRLRAAP